MKKKSKRILKNPYLYKYTIKTNALHSTHKIYKHVINKGDNSLHKSILIKKDIASLSEAENIIYKLERNIK